MKRPETEKDMDNSQNRGRTKRQVKKKSALSLIIAVGVILLSAAEAGDFDLSFLRYNAELRRALPFILTVVFIIAVAAISVFAAKTAMKRAKSSPGSFRRPFDMMKAEHSHEDLESTVLRRSSCEGIDHWREQLDQFKKNGLIEQDEYNKLLAVWDRNQTVNR
ncbi:MAG: hypothetical protein II441_02545 [Oscillospiraceae bacterium]|jgi:hypothetical protein|nr:hypothetical protein [Oscillospiraceae bacterium]